MHYSKKYLNLFYSAGQTSSFAASIFWTLSLRIVLPRHWGYNVNISGDMRRRIILGLHVMSGI